MALQDLFQSFAILQQGLQQFQTSRAISGAREKIANIRDLQRQEITAADLQFIDEDARDPIPSESDVKQDLILQLAGLGTPASTLKAIAGSGAGLGGFKDIKTPLDAQKMFLLTGNKVFGKLAQGLQAFKSQGAEERFEVTGGPERITLSETRAQELKQTRQDKSFERFSKLINPRLQVRSAAGRLASASQDFSKLFAIIAPKIVSGKFDEITDFEFREMASTMSRGLTGGVPAMQQIEDLIPHTGQSRKQNIKTFLTGEPQPLLQGKFVELYNSFIERELMATSSLTADNVLDVANGFKGVLRDNPKEATDAVADQLNIPPQDVFMKDGKITTKEKEESNEKIEFAIQDYNAATKLLKNKDPAKVQKGMRVIKALGMRPRMPQSLLREKLTFLIRGGFLLGQ